ncbi:GNAT family N-acetyltransferase [Spiroplasma endosymbiont of Andrena trimmerana]|uniref:GNAT family N-acetyltransferase n=1 Tax=Spiroplasma endosymbiont of Andrena trimmerana TaxID=3066316 RepID=UPI0030CEB1EF
MIFFETPRLKIRQWKDSDLDELVLLNSDKDVMKYFSSTLSKDDTEKYFLKIKNNLNNNGFGFYAVEFKKDNKFIGFIGFSEVDFIVDFRPCIEIGWRFKKSVWGQGIATEIAKECLKYAKNNLKLTEIYSFTSILNIKSENVMKRIGMKKIKEFYHPKINKSDILAKHVLYKINI